MRAKTMTWSVVPANQFPAYAERWQQLNVAAGGSPLLHIDFVQPLLSEFSTGKELLAYYERNGRTLVMAILRQRRTGTWETFQPSQAPIGMWMHLPGQDIEALLNELMRELPGFPLVIGVTQCDPTLMPRPPDRNTLKTIDYVDTAKITIKGTFEQYWEARGKNLRTNLKKQRARLLKEGIRVRMQTSRAPQDIAGAIADYGRLESAGWKAQGGTAIHPDNAQGGFYTSMLEGFCRRGAGAVVRYWFNDKLVAMDLRIEGAGSLIFLKTTYDEEVPAYYSPALLMREETCQRVFEEQKFNTLEFYGKAIEWQLRWTNELRTMYHVNSYRWAAMLQFHTIFNNRAAMLRQLRGQLAAQSHAAPQGNTSTE
jgi:CelD/BcsL family acetyltransferase involved in cellulose biosynthesis